MAMVVKNNLAAVRTLNILNGNSSALNKSLARVSSGMKITGAQDDAAGYAISERMRVRIRALDQANQNTQNDSSLMKTAEGAVGNTVEILRALKEKAINSANDANTDEDRQTIQKEINQFIDQIDDNALVTFNGKYLVDGSKNNAATATKTVLLNQSLEKGTLAADPLTTLKNRAGDSLGIQSTDYYQVSWVQNGTIHTTSGQVGTESLTTILDSAGVPGKITATGETTTADGVTVKGLIGTTEAAAAATTDPMDGWETTGMTLQASDQIHSYEGIKALLPDIAENLQVLTTDGDSYSITGYAVEPDDESATEATKVNITVTYTVDADTNNTGYSIAIADTDGNAITDSKELYQTSQEVPSKVLYDTDGNAIAPTDIDALEGDYSSADYLTVPTKSDATITSNAYLDDTNADDQALVATAIGDTWANFSTNATTANDAVELKNLYFKDADGNYQQASGITAWYDATKAAGQKIILVGGTLDQGVDEDDGAGATAKYVYTIDKTEVDAAAKATINQTVGGTAVDEIKVGADLPATITVETYEEPKEEDTTPTVVDKFKKALYTPDKTEGLAFVADKEGVDDQVAGLTISIIDQDHNVKKAANAALDQFKQYQRAENQTGDMALNFHIGSEANQAIKVGLGDMRAQALGLKGSNGERIDVFTKDNANAAINAIENALTKALDQQTTIGAIEARLEYTSTNLTTSSENVQAAESTIRDADMAKEMTNYTKANVLLQAAQAMLAQANQSSSGVLSLLQ